MQNELKCETNYVISNIMCIFVQNQLQQKVYSDYKVTMFLFSFTASTGYIKNKNNREKWLI